MDTIYSQIQDTHFASAPRSSNRVISASVSLKKHQLLSYQSARVHCEQHLPAVLSDTPMFGYLQFSAKTELLKSWRQIYTFRQLTKCWKTHRDIYHVYISKTTSITVAYCILLYFWEESGEPYHIHKIKIVHKAWGNCYQFPGTQEGRQINDIIKHMHVHR